MLFGGGFTFANFTTDIFAIFLFVLWFWLLITVSRDLFRRDDVSGLGKVLWVVLLIVAPYIGVFAYLLTQGRGMAQRNHARVGRTQDEFRRVMGYSVADEIAKLDKLKATNSITLQEYSRLRARLVE
jgi:hypothetical protein